MSVVVDKQAILVWPGDRWLRACVQVYDLMQSIGGRCGVDDCRPHRLRDTFAVRALLRDVPIGDVSKLLGHSSVKITEMYYAKWIPARGSRLEGLVAKTLMNADGNGLGNR
jgi:integrase